MYVQFANITSALKTRKMCALIADKKREEQKKARQLEWENIKEKYCENCGNIFLSLRPRKTCSHECYLEMRKCLDR